MSSKVTHVLLPLLIFPTLAALAYHYIVGHTDASGWGDKLKIQCLEDPANPYAGSYTGIAHVDTVLCILVSVFHASFTPVSLPFTMWFLTSAPPITAYLYLEAYRKNTPFPISFPIIPGVLMQTVTFGATFPTYWLLSILTGVTSRRASGGNSQVNRAHAEAVAFGVFIGMFIPTISMLILHDPTVTAIWQFFPFYASIAMAAHLFVRPAHKSQDSGFTIIVFLYIASFIISSSMHLAVVSSRFHDFELLKSFFVPSTSQLDLSLADDYHALHLLQWDAIFGFSATILGTLWFARSTPQFFGLLLWHIVAVPVFGPGAAIAGVALWRENYLHSDNSTPKSASLKK
ncbi:hypothetical protein K435DRAFT_708900 [Dendrothele bispora CBS 962.96]|uniref:Uncharacterized protein n=1 Tax=Dendrothele bispora (strain CBS 962.96) TaxID=1314807 RepID=A0A4S8MWV6_DENBC|nr:hypothetical protein K435DRAFT_708900 [Dendrothele bispora CBS 962.96]